MTLRFLPSLAAAIAIVGLALAGATTAFAEDQEPGVCDQMRIAMNGAQANGNTTAYTEIQTQYSLHCSGHASPAMSSSSSSVQSSAISSQASSSSLSNTSYSSVSSSSASRASALPPAGFCANIQKNMDAAKKAGLINVYENLQNLFTRQTCSVSAASSSSGVSSSASTINCAALSQKIKIYTRRKTKPANFGQLQTDWNTGCARSSESSAKSSVAATVHAAAFASIDIPYLATVYKDMNGLMLSASDMAKWMRKLPPAATRAEIVTAVTNDNAVRSTQITGWYEEYLSRKPSSIELLTDTTLFSASRQTEEEVQAGILGSAEYYGKFVSSEDYINKLYALLLSRAPTTSERDWGQTQVIARTRTQLALSLLRSPEYRKKVIAGFYKKYLDREPTSSELTMKANDATRSLQDVRTEILVSSEFTAK